MTITCGVKDMGYYAFKNRFNEIEKENFYKEKIPMKHCLKNIWLFKPMGMNCGRGIELFRTF